MIISTQALNITECEHDWKTFKDTQRCEKCNMFGYNKNFFRFKSAPKLRVKNVNPFKCSNTKCKKNAFVYLGKDGSGNRVFSCGEQEHSDLLQKRVHIETEN